MSTHQSPRVDKLAVVRDEPPNVGMMNTLATGCPVYASLPSVYSEGENGMKEIVTPIIDAHKGIFAIGKTFIIKPTSTFDEVLGFGLHDKVWDAGSGYKCIDFEIVVEDEHSRVNDLIFYIGTCFFNANIERVNLGFRKKYEKQVSWDDWTEEGEIKQKNIYATWLKKMIGTANKQCNWGSISAYYDQKSAGSGILIQYKNKEADLDYKTRMAKI